jgi:rare lipoprotein A
MKKILTLLISIIIACFAFSKTMSFVKQSNINQKLITTNLKDSISDTSKEEVYKLKPFLNNAHASYYHDKFNGRKTSSGTRFDNNKYSAAHKKLPFGTKVKVTNLASGKSVIVEIIDRGPFVKSREIDLTKRAFMEIAKNKGIGVMMVNIEVVE